ncbi:MAG: hypothetical protein HKN48_09410 [Flavobacteriaceae bacterium]|nr:hypothetical protein [Flavobacteriaceae bacterium]
MLKRFFIACMLITTGFTVAQQGTTSPYSFFGIGSLKFKGTVENRTMGGLSVFSDSIHLNLQNPAAISRLRLVNYSLAVSHKFNSLETSEETQQATTTTLDYLAIGIPMGKFGAAFGLIPYTASGYKLQNEQSGSTTQYEGFGGLNKAFFQLGYQITPEISLGLDANYNFGNIENRATNFQDGIQLGTREINRATFLGFSFNLGAQYQGMVTEDLQFSAGATYTPETDFTAENSRLLATLTILPSGTEQPIDIRDIIVADTEFTFPSQFTAGAGIGKPKKWFVGGEYTSQKTSNFTTTSFELENVVFEDASKFKIGGYYIPNFNGFGSYWKRVVYRAGVRFEEAGLQVNGESINEFGMSFGMGLPVGRLFSNVNLGFEIGRRGTTNAGLVKETFFNTFISLSLNDRWFEKRLYD